MGELNNLSSLAKRKFHYDHTLAEDQSIGSWADFLFKEGRPGKMGGNGDHSLDRPRFQFTRGLIFKKQFPIFSFGYE